MEKHSYSLVQWICKFLRGKWSVYTTVNHVYRWGHNLGSHSMTNIDGWTKIFSQHYQVIREGDSGGSELELIHINQAHIID